MDRLAPELAPDAAETSRVGQVVSGRYRIEKLLGEGGMGAVYLAEHMHMRKRVALKLLHAEMSQDPEVLARFRREAEAAAHIEHPNVAAATDFGQTEDGSFFLVLEYVEGTGLRKVLADGPMAPRRALHVVRQVAVALERAHGAGIVHRDLKPDNVMLVQKGDDPDFVKVLDFGMARMELPTRDASAPLTRLGTILGTPEYMSPEQAMGDVAGPTADLYTVGVMLYEMLTGKLPFDAPDRMAILSLHIVAPVPAMIDRNPGVEVPPPIEELVRRLLEKDSAKRVESARALIDAIDAITLVVPAAQPSEPRPDPRWNDRDALAHTHFAIPASTPALPTSSVSLPGSPTTILTQVSKLPRAVLIAVPLVLVLVLVLALVLGRSSKPTTAAAGTPSSSGANARPAPKRASPSALQAASTEGVAALEKLAADFPEDGTVRRELARALGSAGRTSDMLRAVDELARLDPEALDDGLVEAVATAATRPETTEEAFALLEGSLGARGVDALVTLSTSKSASLAIQKRATKSVARPEIRAKASASTGVMLDLKNAKKCEEKHDLLERAKASGDARLLPTLKSMKSPRGCGFMGMRDCWPCLRKDDALEDAIRAVEARSSK